MALSPPENFLFILQTIQQLQNSLQSIRTLYFKHHSQQQLNQSDKTADQLITSSHSEYIARKADSVLHVLSTIKPQRLNDWGECELRGSTIQQQFVSNVRPSTKFVHVSRRGETLMFWKDLFKQVWLRTNLRRLRIYESDLSDDHVAIICHNFPLLVWLNLHTNYVTDAGAVMISASLGYLVVLYLTNNKLTLDGVIACAASLHRLEQLWVCNCGKYSDGNNIDMKTNSLIRSILNASTEYHNY